MLFAQQAEGAAGGKTGKYDPSIWLAYDLSKLFGMTIEELFDFERSTRK